MIPRARHLQEDRLFECYLTAQDGMPIEPPAAEHLADCAECAARYEDLRRFMDGLRSEADAELDEIFPPERLRAQQQQIAQKIEHLGHAARVISFPGHPPGAHAAGARARVAPRWLGAAAAAGLLIGIAAGNLFYSGTTVTEPEGEAAVSSVGPVEPPGAATSAPELANDINETFLLELEPALERPHTRELVALDELTPHVREIRYQLR